MLLRANLLGWFNFNVYKIMLGSNHQIQLKMSIFTIFLEIIPLFHKVQTCNSMVDITQTGIDIPPWKVYIHKYIYIRTKSWLCGVQLVCMMQIRCFISKSIYSLYKQINLNTRWYHVRTFSHFQTSEFPGWS